MPKIAIFVTNGSEDIEFITPLDIFRRLNFDVDLVSIENDKKILSKSSVSFFADKTLTEIDLYDYGVFLIAGGAVLDNFENGNTDKLRDFCINNFDNNDYIFGAICAAPHIFNYWGLLNDRMVTNFPKIDVEGGFSEKSTGNRLEISKNLITSIGPGSAALWAREIANLLCDKNGVDDLFFQMQFKNLI